jgi:glycosyltransferase involved in cell wall biosynthesis
MDVLAQAFWSAFLDDPDVELYLKTSQAWEARKQVYTLKGVERFIVDDTQMSHDDLVALYHSAHVFVLPSRGEGWGFPAMEAIATGCPTVATDYSGLREFVTPQTAWPIRHGWAEVDYGHMTRAAQPDVTHLTETLLSIRHNYRQAAQKAIRGAATVKECFSWAQTAQRTLDCLQRIQRRTHDLHSRACPSRSDRLPSRLAGGVSAGV